MANQTINVAEAGTAPDVGVTAMQGTMADQTINVAKAGTASDVGVTALKGTMAAQNLTVSVAATPTIFTSSVTTDGAFQAKPVVHVYDDPAATSQVATVDPSKVTLNANGTVTIDLSALPAAITAAGTYTVKAVDETTISTPGPVTVGSGYNVSEPPPNVTFTAGPVGSLSATSTSINPSGSVTISFAGNPSGAGPITVSVDDSTTATMGKGLLDENLHLWDFSVPDFTRYIQVIANVIAVNGSETSSFNFNENLLGKNMQNLEMANGRIIDVDMAAELTLLANNKIKLSSAADMLAKHNKLSSMVDLTVMNLT
jgi:flagellin-like hook-associated protein FlgL